MSRWHLAIAGTLCVGVVVVMAWVMLLPYTMGDFTAPSFLIELQQQWNESRVKSPVETQNITSLLVEARAQAAIQPGQQIVSDPAHQFSIVAPAAWTIVSQRDGVVELRLASTTATIAYPVAVTDVLFNATNTAVRVDNIPALLSVVGDRSQIVAQAVNGYAMLSVVGPNASALIIQLMAGVYLSE